MSRRGGRSARWHDHFVAWRGVYAVAAVRRHRPVLATDERVDRAARGQPVRRLRRGHPVGHTEAVNQPYPGIYLWRDQHGHTYLVDHTGTRQTGRTDPTVDLPDLTAEIYDAPDMDIRDERRHTS